MRTKWRESYPGNFLRTACLPAFLCLLGTCVAVAGLQANSAARCEVRLASGAIASGQLRDANIGGIDLLLDTGRGAPGWAGVPFRISWGEVVSVEVERPQEFLEAEELVREGDIEGALRIYRSLADSAKVAPATTAGADSDGWNAERARFRIIDCQMALQRANLALAEYLEAIRAHPDTVRLVDMPRLSPEDASDPEILALLRDAEMGSLPSADERVRESDRAFLSQMASVLWADVHILRGELREAQQRLRKMLSTDDWRIVALVRVRWAVLKFHEGDRDDAVLLLEKAKNDPAFTGPLRAELFYQLGRLLLEMGERERAELELMRLPMIFGYLENLSAECLHIVAEEMEASGRAEEASRAYESLLKDFVSARFTPYAAERLRQISAVPAPKTPEPLPAPED